MKFSKRQDVDAPIDYAFDQASNFAGFEKQAMRRGIELARADDLATTSTGMRWDATFLFRGKPRKLKAELVAYDAPNAFLIDSHSSGVNAALSVDFMTLSRSKTRIIVGLELRPTNLSARLLIQSLKFAKSNLYSRFEARVENFGKSVEEGYSRGIGQSV